MLREFKEPAGPPPEASLLGIPPELRNEIYRLVVDDIDEVDIIGRKLKWKEATPGDHAWLWDAMAKHPLNQACRQTRQEFDPIHQRRALVTGVARYRLELENFDLDRIKDFNKLSRDMPRVIHDRMREAVCSDHAVIRFNLSKFVLFSVNQLNEEWATLDRTFSSLRHFLNISDEYLDRCIEVNLNLQTPAMTPAQRNMAPTDDLATKAKRKLRSIYKYLDDDLGVRGHLRDTWTEDGQCMCHFRLLSRELDYKHSRHFKPLKEAREKGARKALKERLRKKLKVRLREELKAELRAEIMNEQKEEAAIELERQILEGLEGWSTDDVPKFD